MRSGLCYACQRLQFFEDVEPEHCFGNGDEPGIPGLIGSGFWCTCPCRKQQRSAARNDGSMRPGGAT